MPSTVPVHVRVVDHEGRRLEGATIQPSADDTPVGEHLGDGRYRIDLPPGQHRLVVRAEGSAGHEVVVDADPTHPADVDVVLGTDEHDTYRVGGMRIPYLPRRDLIAVAPRSQRGRDVVAVILAAASDLGLQRAGDDRAPRDTLLLAAPADLDDDARLRVMDELAALPEVAHVGDVVLLRERSVSFVTDEFLITFAAEDDRASRATELEARGWELLRWLPYAPGTALVRAVGVRGYRALSRLDEENDDDRVVRAEPNLVSSAEDDFTPNDSLLDQQPHLEIIGAEQAWDVTFGDADVRIAVVDSGCDIDHPDLDVPGKIVDAWDFENMDADPTAGTHGTKSTGIATAAGDNTEGISGVAPGCRVMPLRRYSSGSDTEYADLYVWAAGLDPESTQSGFPATLGAGAGADVITSSFGIYQTSLSAAMQGALDTVTTDGRDGRGCVVVFSVGNDNQDFTVAPARQWAASDRTVAVASSAISPPDDDEVKVSTSNFGPSVDVSAPGGGPGGGTETRTLSTTDVGAGDTPSSAGGSDDYDDFGQTSCAAPQVAGAAALVLSVAPDLTWTEVRDLLRTTATRIDAGNTNATGQYVDNDGDGIAEFSQWYGFGRLDVGAAVCQAIREVEVLSSDVHFLDVVAGETAGRAVRVRVRSCDGVDVAITDGPTLLTGTGTFGTALDTSQTVVAPDGIDVLLWITYSNPDANEMATGVVTVTADGVAVDVPIIANTIPRPTAAIALALDQSGSMGSTSGFAAPFDTREAVLQFAALPIADLLHDDDMIGMVTFDADGHPLMAMEEAGDSAFGGGRANARSALLGYAHTPGGLTSIGDGVEHAHDLLDPVTGKDVKATVVLTDGHETASKYISEVSGLIDERVYAIGLGTADVIEPAALTSLTDGTGGYLLLTGELGASDQFLLAKYYLQVLAGVHNTDVVLDPEGTLLPGQRHTIPFLVNDQDLSVDVVLLSDAPGVLDLVLEAPDGSFVTPATPGVTSTRAASTVYRFLLPVVGGAHGGRWSAHVLWSGKQGAGLLSSAAAFDVDVAGRRGRPIRYSLNVHAWSNVRFAARLHQSSNVPGATMTIRGRLTETDIPLEGRADAVATVVAPDGTVTGRTLVEVAPGIFETSFSTVQSGVHRARVVVTGRTRRGQRFTREHLLTGQVWRRGNDPLPGPGDSTDAGSDLCALVRCVLGSLRGRGWKHLESIGLDTERLRRCLAEQCGHDAPPPTQLDLDLDAVDVGSLLGAIGRRLG